MGKIKQGILGGVSGKIANVIGGSWKGIAYLRAMPLSVANPRTAGQVDQRNRLSLTVAVAQNMLAEVIKPLNDRFVSHMSGYNAFVQRNINDIIGVTQAHLETLLISVGNLVPCTPTSVVCSPSSFSLNWVDNTGTGNALSTDLAYMIVYNATQSKLVAVNNGNTRGDSTSSIAPAAGLMLSGDYIAYAVAFLSADKSKVTYTRFQVIQCS